MWKAIATVAVWGGTVLLAHLFHLYDLLSGTGAAWMFVGAIVVTISIWKPEDEKEE
ncbi:MAG: hypothetical protein G01um101448_229 [Parcubacteria group bacterium Gr01-1014_48]|nr:MAG: hypothetical protein Greene041614_657 [Parcubacteria group bacterium Greene0416_14]TSC74285.1 MAG: hypothetical protein G01um101448_229 [Parcubacteria group bacterium Gr01-1014_48]